MPIAAIYCQEICQMKGTSRPCCVELSNSFFRCLFYFFSLFFFPKQSTVNYFFLPQTLLGLISFSRSALISPRCTSAILNGPNPVEVKIGNIQLTTLFGRENWH